MLKTFQIFFIGSIAAFVLTACGPSQEDAKKLGFSSIEEMKDFQAKGFKSMDDYAKSLGYESIQQMKAKYEDAKISGFVSVEEMDRYRKEGFKTKKDYLDSENDLNAGAIWLSDLQKWQQEALLKSNDGGLYYQNRSRAEQEAFNDKKATLAEFLKQAPGKKFTNQTCWWQGRQVDNISTLACYDNDGPYISNGQPSFMDGKFYIPLTPEQSKAIGPVYKKDKFIFTGIIERAEGQYPIDGNRFTAGPIQVYVRASSVERK